MLTFLIAVSRLYRRKPEPAAGKDAKRATIEHLNRCDMRRVYGNRNKSFSFVVEFEVDNEYRKLVFIWRVKYREKTQLSD